jgi:transcriptional regulator with XRE-family HTH domain
LESENFDLKAELKSIGMTQKDFAIFTKVHLNSVGRWVRKESETPNWVFLLIKYYKKSKALEEIVAINRA